MKNYYYYYYLFIYSAITQDYIETISTTIATITTATAVKFMVTVTAVS